MNNTFIFEISVVLIFWLPVVLLVAISNHYWKKKNK